MGSQYSKKETRSDKEYAQKKDGWCGPAALSFALSHIGIDVPQEKLARDTKTTTKAGVDPYPLAEVAKIYGAKTHILNGNSPKDTLIQLDKEVKQGHAVIVDYLVSGEDDGGHYVVFLGKQGNNVKLWDPSGGKKTMMDTSYFIANWKDKEENGKEMKNWAMVLGA